MADEILNFFGMPRKVEVPAGQEAFRLRVVAARAVEELPERELLQLVVVLALLEAAALAKADRVQKLLAPALPVICR